MDIYQRFTKEIVLQNRNKARPQEVSLWRQEYRPDVNWEQVSEAVWILRSHLIIEAMWGFPGGSDGKESACNSRDPGSWVRKIPWRRAWQPTPVFLPGESHGQRSLVGVTHSQTRLKWLSMHSHLHSLHKQNNEVWTLQLSKQLI